MVGQSDMPVLNSANPGSRASGWGLRYTGELMIFEGVSLLQGRGNEGKG